MQIVITQELLWKVAPQLVNKVDKWFYEQVERSDTPMCFGWHRLEFKDEGTCHVVCYPVGCGYSGGVPEFDMAVSELPPIPPDMLNHFVVDELRAE